MSFHSSPVLVSCQLKCHFKEIPMTVERKFPTIFHDVVLFFFLFRILLQLKIFLFKLG